jgi:hypothetical protein
MATPVFAVEAIYLDTVPVTNPGEYLAPADFYMRVPPPTVSFSPVAGSLVPATVYDLNVLNTRNTTKPARNTGAYLASAADSETETDTGGEKLRVLLKAGLDHASDVPLAVMREHLSEAENIELVGEGQGHDVLVEIETMKPGSSATVFIVVNAYKVVDGENLIFYNTFGYMGELKLLAGSGSYAANLEIALEAEAQRLDD